MKGCSLGSAFPQDEREAFGLQGLVPLHCSTIDEQLERTYENFRSKTTAIEKYIFLASLQDRNEILFYRLVQTHIAEMVPILYTPTVGEACERYSHLFRRSRGLYLSYPDTQHIFTILRQAAPEDIHVIVVTDGERILGLGDLGVGGMGIPIGKLTLYTLCAGIDPRRTLPVLLDVGTNNPKLLNDPLYLGWRHPRLEPAGYDAFIDQFVQAVHDRWPHALLQWEDFAKHNAWRLLERHRRRHLSFNDDIQGTAAVAVAGLLRAVKIQKQPLANQRVVIAGAGSAATGIGALLGQALREEGLTDADIRERIYLVDSKGLVHEGRTDLSVEKTSFAQSRAQLRALGLPPEAPSSLHAVVQAVRPTALIGTSGQAGMFDESLIRAMAAFVERPIIFPLSNPTSKSEAAPADLIRWTDGRALIATGSPYAPVEWKGTRIPIGQCNNAFIFPGLGLGLTAAQASSVSESHFLAAARTLAAFDQRLPGDEASLFPNLEHVRIISAAIAREVAGAETAERIASFMWEPEYPTLRPA